METEKQMKEKIIDEIVAMVESFEACKSESAYSIKFRIVNKINRMK